jgi:hypothetical protein
MNLQASLSIAVGLIASTLAIGGSSVAHADIERRLDVIPVDSSQLDIAPFDAAGPEAIESRVIYLNRCAGGCTITRGNDSAVNNTSGIIGVSTAHFTEWSYGDSEWNQLVQCVREVYAPFNISIVDSRPTSGVYWMNIVAGTAAQGGFENGVLGVSPGTNFCPSPLLNNTVTFTFANDPNTSTDTNYLCWIAAQETAHSFGLDHEALANDAMTYIGLEDGTPPRHTFINQAGQCGAQSPGDNGCYCPSIPTQNSYSKILGIFGASAPTPPIVTITSPANGAQVEPGFPVGTTVVDDNGIAQVSISVDGNTTATLTSGPYAFNTPADLGEGTHRVIVTATDNQGTPGSATIDVIIGAPCETPGDCVEQGPDLTCVGGRCVPGEGADGGLGDTCAENAECYSGHCQGSTEGSYCVEECALDSNDCPSGFGCIANGDAGICWPGADGGGGGCLSADDETPTLPIALGIVLGALMLRRRRQRT